MFFVCLSRISSRRFAELHEGFAARPRVLTALHRLVGEVGVAVSAGVLENLLLDGYGAFEEFGMAICKTDPFGLALEEAEVAAGARAPLVVVRAGRRRPRRGSA